MRMNHQISIEARQRPSRKLATPFDDFAITRTRLPGYG